MMSLQAADGWNFRPISGSEGVVSRLTGGDRRFIIGVRSAGGGSTFALFYRPWRGGYVSILWNVPFRDIREELISYRTSGRLRWSGYLKETVEELTKLLADSA